MDAQTTTRGPGAPIERLLGVPDLMRLLGVSRSAIYRLLAAGRLPRGFKVGQQLRWRPEVVRRWLETREAADAR